MDNNNQLDNFENQGMTLTLTFEDDLVVECEIVAVFPVNGKEYMALLPVEEVEGIDPEELFIYRYIPTDDDSEDVQLESIEDDDEYEAVADAFDQLLAEEDFNELIDDEE